MQAPRGHARDLKPPTCPLPWHTASARQTRAAAGGGGGRGGRTLRETSVRTARHGGRSLGRRRGVPTARSRLIETAPRGGGVTPRQTAAEPGWGMGGERPGTGHAGATRPSGVDGAGLGPGLGRWTQPRQPPTPCGCAPSSPASEPKSGCREPRPHGLRCSVICSPHSRRLNPPVC